HWATHLEDGFGGSFQALALAATHDEQRGVRFCFPLPHCFKKCGIGILRRLAPASKRVFVALHDSERIGMRGCASHSRGSADIRIPTEPGDSTTASWVNWTLLS